MTKIEGYIHYTSGTSQNAPWQTVKSPLTHIGSRQGRLQHSSKSFSKLFKDFLKLFKEFYPKDQGVFKKALDVLFTTKYTEFHGVLLSNDCEADESYARIIIIFRVYIQNISDNEIFRFAQQLVFLPKGRLNDNY